MARSCSSLDTGTRPIEKKDFTCSGARFDSKLANLCAETRYHALWDMLNGALSKGKYDPLDPRIPLIYKDIRAAKRFAKPMRRLADEDRTEKAFNDYLALVGRLPVYIPYALSAEIVFRIQALVTEKESQNAIHLMKSHQPPERYFVV